MRCYVTLSNVFLIVHIKMCLLLLLPAGQLQGILLFVFNTVCFDYLR